MKAALAALLTSKKFTTALIAIVVSAVVGVGARWGLQLDTALVTQLVAASLGVFAVLIHAQGQTDLGREAAKAPTLMPAEEYAAGIARIQDALPLATQPPGAPSVVDDKAIIDAIRRNPGALRAILDKGGL